MLVKTIKPNRLVGALVLAVASGLGLGAPSAAADDFYAGKTINFIVGTDITGGFTIYARLIARHLGRHIPGNPTVVVKNMPGAGGKTAAAFLFQQAPKDGTSIAALPPNSISAKLLGQKVEVDPTKFFYLAGAERGTRLCMSFHTSRIKTFDDALREKAVIGVTSTGSPTSEYAAFVKHATGAKFELVSGYRGPGDLFLAMERREIDGVCGLDWIALKAQQPVWLSEKKLNLLIQANLKPEPELVALGVPQPWKYIKDDTDRKAVELMVGFQQAFGKAYVAPPGVPAERVALLRSAFNAALKDKALLEDAKKVRVEIAAQTGEEVQRAVQDLYDAPEPVVERLRKIVLP